MKVLLPAPQDAHVTHDILWKSCCLEMDARVLLFFSQLIISLLVLLFCIFEIATLPDSEWAKMTGTFILGVWLPAPRASK